MQILHFSHLSIEIIFEATPITIVHFVHKDILQLETFVLIQIYVSSQLLINKFLF